MPPTGHGNSGSVPCQRNGVLGAPGKPATGFGAGTTLDEYTKPASSIARGAHGTSRVSEKKGARYPSTGRPVTSSSCSRPARQVSTTACGERSRRYSWSSLWKPISWPACATCSISAGRSRASEPTTNTVAFT
jgi:hypothetical protein